MLNFLSVDPTGLEDAAGELKGSFAQMSATLHSMDPMVWRALLAAVLGIALYALLLFPLTRRIQRWNDGRLERFRAAAVADGRAVTGRLCHCEHRRHTKGAGRGNRMTEFYVKYAYRPTADGPELTTGTLTCVDRPADVLTLYLYPNNSRRFRTDSDLQNEGSTRITGLSMLSAVLAIGLAYLALGAFFH